jgi:hypothetical protein
MCGAGGQKVRSHDCERGTQKCVRHDRINHITRATNGPLDTSLGIRYNENRVWRRVRPKTRSHERGTIPAGNVSCGKNRFRAIRKEPAQSRLQPELAAPQSSIAVSERKWHLAAGRLTIPTEQGGECVGHVGGS